MPHNRIKLCYCSNFTNFGDALSPRLIEHLLGAKVEYADAYHADLMAVGSLFYSGEAVFCERPRGCSRRWLIWLRRKAVGLFKTPLVVWGSGFLKSPIISRHNLRYLNLDIRALRGTQTRDILLKAGFHVSQNIALGDPGLFYPDLVPGIYDVKKEYDLAIVPGHAALPDGERLLSSVRRLGIKCRLIDVMQEDPLQTLVEIASAKKVVGSAMHALIVADAMRIPSRLIDFRYSNPWKVSDYYSAYGMASPEILSLEKCVADPQRLLEAIPDAPFVSEEDVNLVKTRLLSVLPRVD